MLCTAHLHSEEDVDCHQSYVCSTVKLSPTGLTAVQAPVCSQTWFFDVEALSLRGTNYGRTDLSD